MDSRITPQDVVLYISNRLTPSRRLAVDEAKQTNPQVRTWFEDYEHPGVLEQPMTTVDLDDPKVARLAAIAFEIVSRKEELDVWLDWFRQPAKNLRLPDSVTVPS